MLAVFAVEQCGDGNNTPLIPQNRLNDPGNRGSDTESRSAFGIFDDIAAIARLGFQIIGGNGREPIPVVGKELGERFAAERNGLPGDKLGVTMLTHDETANVTRVQPGLLADNGLQSRGIKRRSGTQHLGA